VAEQVDMALAILRQELRQVHDRSSLTNGGNPIIVMAPSVGEFHGCERLFAEMVFKRQAK
jgi:hypothetical protein